MGFGQGDGYDRGPREMHKATCEECKQECEVPFKPSGDRPVSVKPLFFGTLNSLQFVEGHGYV